MFSKDTLPRRQFPKTLRGTSFEFSSLTMRNIILFCVIQQLLYHVSRVKSLTGQNVMPIRGGELPFFATFQLFPIGFNFCGGALITKKHVITSALCSQYGSSENLRIVFEVANDEQQPALSYTAASWTTYIDWARGRGIPYNGSLMYNLAIVELTDKVYHVNPVSISGLTKSRLDGTTAIMTGRENDVPSKATAMLLSDQDCEGRTRVLVNDTSAINDRLLCSAADPFTLLDIADVGSPLLDANGKTLLGISFGKNPGDLHVRGSFSIESIRSHQVNIFYNIHSYRSFIHSVVPAVPGA